MSPIYRNFKVCENQVKGIFFISCGQRSDVVPLKRRRRLRLRRFERHRLRRHVRQQHRVPRNREFREFFFKRPPIKFLVTQPIQ